MNTVLDSVREALYARHGAEGVFLGAVLFPSDGALEEVCSDAITGTGASTHEAIADAIRVGCEHLIIEANLRTFDNWAEVYARREELTPEQNARACEHSSTYFAHLFPDEWFFRWGSKVVVFDTDILHLI